MKNFKLNIITDFLFFSGILFFIFFLWSRFFLHDLWLSVLISAAMTFVVMSLYHVFSTKKQEAKKITNKEKDKANRITTNFLLSKKQDILKVFFTQFDKKYNTKIKSDYLLINDCALRPIYTTQKITDKDILESYEKIKDTSLKKLIITCRQADDGCYLISNLIDDKEIIILTELEAYENIFKPLLFDVPNNIKENNKSKKLSHYLSIALNKSRTKNYLTVSIFMLFASFVLKYNIYYLVFSSITGFLALYSYFNLRFNKKQQKFI